MPPKGPELYNLNKTTVWFAIASVILLVCLVAMVLEDSHREWKHYQKEFMRMQREMAVADLEKAAKKADQKQLDKLNEQLTAAEQAVDARAEEVKQLESELAANEVELVKAKAHFQDLTQNQDSDRYFFEEYRAHHDDEKAAYHQKRLEERAPLLMAARVAKEELEAKIESVNASLGEIRSEQSKFESEIKRFNREQEQLEKKIKKLSPDLSKVVLNAPMLDFINPTFKIQQNVLKNLEDDFYFLKTEKVDRCITCHLGIDQKGFETAEQPFRTHPKLDMFVSPDSPHPLEEFGCTTCHGGSGHSVDFVDAAHMPDSPEQAAEWKEKYNWHPLKHWPDKMFPKKHVEASCAKCHKDVLFVPEAPILNEGRKLAQTYGCFACHKIDDGFYDKRWKVGPNLMHVQSKLEHDWIARWLHNPKEFRPSTKMPQVFHLSNTSDPESKEKNDASIAGIAAYLMKNSEPITLQSLPEGGNAENGQKLIEDLGCLGCHKVGDKDANNHGPELTALGSKVSGDWLFTWLKNPHQYYEDSRMPDLRLTDKEATDIASYLLQDKNEKFESIRLPRVNPDAVNELALSFLSNTARYQDAQAQLDKMSENERLEFVGQKMIGHQGCYACHDIKGFEDAKPIGTELTQEGSKEVAKFDFGLQHDLPHTREAWIYQKLKEPRIFDEGKEKKFLEKLRMPDFGFTDEQANAITTFVLSLVKTEISLDMQKRLDLKDEQVEQGRLLVSKFNCQGCHSLDGVDGAVRAVIDDEGLMPPVLHGEGAKVREGWLYRFLEDPTTIRPWLSYRMPTFGLEHDELTTFIHYFNHLSDVEPDFNADKFPDTTPEKLAAGKELFVAFQCMKCHQAEPPKGLSASFLAPNLVMAGERLRPQWMSEWMEDPQQLQEGTMMPTFFYDGQSPMAEILDGDMHKQIEAMRDYMLVFTPEEAASIKAGAQAAASSG